MRLSLLFPLVPLVVAPLGLLSVSLGWGDLKRLQPTGLQGEWLTPEWQTPWVAGLNPDPAINQILAQYLAGLDQQGWSVPDQGLWIQAGNSAIAQHRGQVPLPAASLTKLATSLAALNTWPLDHRFETWVGMDGSLNNGVLQGDLVLRGGGDPLFVWEEGIVLANHLQTLGIQRVTGDLVIAGDFTMNFGDDVQESETALRDVMHTDTWTGAVWAAYRRLEPNTAQPSLTLEGTVRRIPATALPADTAWLVRHQSLPLVALLKAMNIYSNNTMAEQIATLLGGSGAVRESASTMAGLAPGELNLVNGSGLGMANTMSPRAAVAMTVALQRELAKQGYSIADVLPVSGEDVGTLTDRHLPATAAVKTGSLAEVSALAGMIPTADRGPVWFAIINRGWDIPDLRRQQDRLLQTIQAHWGEATVPATLATKVILQTGDYRYGDPRRNLAP